MIKIEMKWASGEVDTLSYDGYTKTGVRVCKTPGYKARMTSVDLDTFRSVYCYIGKSAEQLGQMTDGRLLSFRKWSE